MGRTKEESRGLIDNYVVFDGCTITINSRDRQLAGTRSCCLVTNVLHECTLYANNVARVVT